MPNLPLTLALEHYDRHVPFFDGRVMPEGVALRALHVSQTAEHGRHGNARHERMLAGEFDVAELSFASYLVARDRGLPFTAIPVFPRRLFSQSRVYVNTAAAIERPADLVGKRVGLNTYQTTLSVLLKGDLHQYYEVPWNEITWVVAREDAVPVELPDGVQVERVPEGAGLDALLIAGDIQALALPHPPRSIQDGAPRVQRLFADPRAEERAYFQRNGYWPIMHVVAFKEPLVRDHPELPGAFLKAFQQADEISSRYYDDPNWSRLAWGRHYLEDEQRELAANVWPMGLARNRTNIERFIGYAHEQGLIRQPMTPESLFVASAREP